MWSSIEIICKVMEILTFIIQKFDKVLFGEVFLQLYTLHIPEVYLLFIWWELNDKDWIHPRCNFVSHIMGTDDLIVWWVCLGHFDKTSHLHDETGGWKFSSSLISYKLFKLLGSLNDRTQCHAVFCNTLHFLQYVQQFFYQQSFSCYSSILQLFPILELRWLKIVFNNL